MIGPDGLLAHERAAWRALTLAAISAAENKGPATAQELRRQADACSRTVPIPKATGAAERDPAVVADFRALIRAGLEWRLISRETRDEQAPNLQALAERCAARLAPPPAPSPERPDPYLSRKDVFG